MSTLVLKLKILVHFRSEDFEIMLTLAVTHLYILQTILQPSILNTTWIIFYLHTLTEIYIFLGHPTWKLWLK